MNDNTNLISQFKGELLSSIGEDCSVGTEVIIEVKNYGGQTYGSILTVDGRNLVNSKSLCEDTVTVSFSMGIVTLYFVESGKLFSVMPIMSYRETFWGVLGLPLLETNKVSVEVRGKMSFVWYKDFLGREFRTEPTQALSLVGGMLKVATASSTLCFDL